MKITSAQSPARYTRGQTSVLGNVLSIFIFIIVAAIALWGAFNAFKIAPSLFRGISAPFTSTREIAITAPVAPVKNGEAFSLTWEHAPASEGLYSFSYSCTPLFTFEAPVAEGGVYGEITCGIPYGVPSTERSIRLVPKNASATGVSVPVSLAFTSSEGERGNEATTSIAILSGDTSVVGDSTAPEAPAKSSTTAKPARPAVSTAAKTPADLTVHILDASSYGGSGSVRFDVQNKGGSATGAWRFEATLPSGEVYSSPTQRSLAPQDGVIFTLSFQDVGGGISIAVDPDDAVREGDEGNNSAYRALSSAYYSDPYTASYEPQYSYPTYYPYDGYGTGAIQYPFYTAEPFGPYGTYNSIEPYYYTGYPYYTY